MKGDKNKGFWIGKWQPILILSSLLVATVIVVACSSGSTATTSGMAAVKVSLSDPATCQAPDGPFSAVWVTISDVQANVSSTAGATDSSWVDLTPGLSKAPMQVNLFAEATNQCFLATLGDNMQLQAGSYQQIRVILATTSANITTADQCNGAGNCVVVGTGNTAKTYPLQLSSEAQTGIKIPSGQIAGGAFNISAGQTKDLNIDFNTCASIVTQGNNQYRLKPVLHAGEVGTTSVSINGKVVDANGNPIVGAMVSLEQPDATSVDRILGQSTATAADGTWVICPVTVGDTSKPYDVVITGGTSTGVLYAPSIVTGVNVGSTFGTVTLYPAPVPANSVANLTGQVTSVNGSSAGIAIDATLSLLETVNGVNYTIPLPMTSTQSMAQSILVTTAAQTTQNPSCAPGSTYCANYMMQAPSTGAYIGAWTTSGATLTQPVGGLLATYIVDGMASPANSTTGTDCNPSELKSTPATALTSTTTYPVTVPTLAFAGCS